ncbi:flagellar basal body protein [Roseivivax lentus]|nr:flagellar basal body protein [Roseivivax lentus]
MAEHAGRAQAATAQNLANADTPGYRAIAMPDFEAALAGARGFELRATRPAHLFGQSPGRPADYLVRDTAVDPNGNSVSIETEMVAAASAKGAHDRALAIYRSGLSILRASLGRR